MGSEETERRAKRSGGAGLSLKFDEAEMLGQGCYRRMAYSIDGEGWRSFAQGKDTRPEYSQYLWEVVDFVMLGAILPHNQLTPLPGRLMGLNLRAERAPRTGSNGRSPWNQRSHRGPSCTC